MNPVAVHQWVAQLSDMCRVVGLIPDVFVYMPLLWQICCQ